jgi:hypothetical protein
MSGRAGLVACGVIVALLTAGCDSGSGAGSSGSGSSGSGSSGGWVKSLGPGVTVTDSSGATAGDGSPAGVILTVVKDMQTGDYAGSCDVLEPSQRTECRSEFNSATTAELKNVIPTFKNFVASFTAVKGDEAVVGNTGTECDPYATPACVTNTDPAAIFDRGEPFADLWQGATAPQSPAKNAYALNALVKSNGTWYAYSSGT